MDHTSEKALELLAGVDRALAEIEKTFSEIREALAERQGIGREIAKLDSRLAGAAERIGQQTRGVIDRPRFYHTATGFDGKRKRTGHYG